VLKYGSNGGASNRGKAGFGSTEMDQLDALRVKLISQKRSLTSFLDSIQLPPSNMATNLDNTGGQLDMILDKVDAIAARLGQRHVDYDRGAWKRFRRGLIAEGFSSDVLQQNEVQSEIIPRRRRTYANLHMCRIYYESTYEKWTKKDYYIGVYHSKMRQNNKTFPKYARERKELTRVV
jgi:hypothetical protein